MVIINKAFSPPSSHLTSLIPPHLPHPTSPPSSHLTSLIPPHLPHPTSPHLIPLTSFHLTSLIPPSPPSSPHHLTSSLHQRRSSYVFYRSSGLPTEPPQCLKRKQYSRCTPTVCAHCTPVVMCMCVCVCVCVCVYVSMYVWCRDKLHFAKTFPSSLPSPAHSCPQYRHFQCPTVHVSL